MEDQCENGLRVTSHKYPQRRGEEDIVMWSTQDGHLIKLLLRNKMPFLSEYMWTGRESLAATVLKRGIIKARLFCEKE
jgi:hypothetical protein